MNPYKMDAKESLGYDLNILKDNFRMIKIIKNRMGADNMSIGVWFNPSGGIFTELPLPNTIEMDNIYYRLKNQQ